MAANSLIVNVTVTKNTRTVSTVSFGTPCVFGPSARIETPQTYTSYNQMLTANGGPFEASDPEAIEGAALFSQAIKPEQIVVAPNSAAVAQVDTLAVGTLTTGHQYKFTLNSIVISYTASGGDTQQSVLSALLTAIGVAYPANPPVTGALTGTGAGALLTLTSTTAGLGVSYTSIDSLLTHAAVTANHSIADDILTAQNLISTDSQFYGVIVTSHAASDILQVAAYIETQLLVYVTATLDAGVLTNQAGNVMATLMGLSYDRTMIMYSAQANTHGPDGAWMGYMLPTTPGIGNWAMKTLVGVAADNLTPTQINNIISNNGNIYVTVGGYDTTLDGITAGGEYLDVTIFLDWLSATIQSNIIAIETSPLNLKVPYTNKGIGMLSSGIRAAMKDGEDNQGLASGWSVFSPNVNDVSPADKADRTLNNIGATGELAGAINKINVSVYVSN
jgi:hypothetical protein